MTKTVDIINQGQMEALEKELEYFDFLAPDKTNIRMFIGSDSLVSYVGVETGISELVGFLVFSSSSQSELYLMIDYNYHADNTGLCIFFDSTINGIEVNLREAYIKYRTSSYEESLYKLL